MHTWSDNGDFSKKVPSNSRGIAVNLVDPSGLQANRTRMDLQPGQSAPVPSGGSYSSRAFGGSRWRSSPRPSAPSYDMTRMAARQAQLVVVSFRFFQPSVA